MKFQSARKNSERHSLESASWVWCTVMFDILSGDQGLLMMCLLWINAQRLTGCINDLHNTSQQFSLILVLFPRVHCNRTSRVESKYEYLVTGHVLFRLHPILHCSPFLFQLPGYHSGYRQLLWELGKGVACRAWGCAVTESVPPFSLEITVSLTVPLPHPGPGGDREDWQGTEGSGVGGVMEDLAHKLLH